MRFVSLLGGGFGHRHFFLRRSVAGVGLGVYVADLVRLF